MSNLALNQRLIESIQADPSGKQLLIRDSNFTGLTLRVNSSGSKSFVLEYRSPTSRRNTKYTIGRASYLTYAQAKNIASTLLGTIAQGKDPQLEKKTRQISIITFHDLISYYREVHMPKNRPSTQKMNNAFLNNAFPSTLLKKELKIITKLELERLINTHNSCISPRTKKQISHSTTNRLISLLKKMFNLAYSQEWIDRNPTRSITKFKELSRERICTENEEKKLLTAIDEIENIYYKAYFQILWLTMARRSEIQHLKWDDLDLEAGLARLKDTKAGRPFTINLPRDAILILTSLPRIVGNPYVFSASGNHRGPINGIDKAWRGIRRTAGLSDIRIHDIRRTGGSNMIMNGASLQDVALLLNHRNLSTTQTYARLTQDHKRKKMEEHGARVGALIPKDEDAG